MFQYNVNYFNCIPYKISYGNTFDEGLKPICDDKFLMVIMSLAIL